MSKVVLDTDILSEILKGKDATVAARARAYRAEHGRYTFTVIAVFEIVRGLRRVQSLSRLDAFMGSVSSDEVLDLDVEAAVLGGEIDSRLTGTGASDRDCGCDRGRDCSTAWACTRDGERESLRPCS